MEDLQRQLRIAITTLLIILPIAVFGFMKLEGLSFIDALWVTTITLTTIGYGDITAKTEVGRIFTLIIILVGMSALLFALQTSFALFASPALRDARQRRRTQRMIDKLENHYIICGMGELVDKTINYLLQRAQMRREYKKEQIYKPLDKFLDRWMGDDAEGHYVRLRAALRNFYLWITHPLHRAETLLDTVVVITQDTKYADHLRNTGLLVVEGDPTDDDVLKRSGITRAQSIMVLLDNDTEALLTTLTADRLNPDLYMTTATLEEFLLPKVMEVGANSALTPYEVAGQFLNNATLRPAVNGYFTSLLFEHSTSHQITQLYLWDDSPWIGKHLGALKLRARFDSAIIGIRIADSAYEYAPSDDYVLRQNEVLLAVAPAKIIPQLQSECRAKTNSNVKRPSSQTSLWQVVPPSSRTIYTLEQAEKAIDGMSQHFIVCGTSRVARNATNKLNPERPFVIISDDEIYTNELTKRGFRVVHGNPTHEETLHKAGVQRAQAIMVALDSKADSVVTVLTCRSLSKRLLITATANSDEMIEKLKRSGADSVVSPFHVAAQFVLLATTRPETSDFVQYVLFNYETGLETTELYMETDSPWIGQTIESLRLDRLFRAGVIGIRLPDRETFIYAPSGDYEIRAHEVLIVVAPMVNADELIASAHGGTTKRPTTLRSKVLQSGTFTREMIQDILDQKG